jgi:hypothetical protein
LCIFALLFFALKNIAEVAHLVEHDLAKVGVAGSSPVFRSKNEADTWLSAFFFSPGWWNW